MRKPSGKINIKIEFFSLLQIQKEWVFFFSVNWLRKEYAASSYILKPNFKIP